MRLTILIACYLCVFLTACSPETTRRPEPISTSGNTKISFGIYDISSSGPNLSSLFARSDQTDQQASQQSAPPTRTSAPAKPAAAEIDKATARSTDLGDDEQGPTRKVIKTVEMHVEDSEPDSVQKLIVDIAESNGGFVLTTDQSISDASSGVRDSVAITIRVPAEKFAGVVDAIRNSCDRFLVESMKGEDVTEEFVDVQARLRAKKALEDQFLQIMKQSESVDEALTVQSRLADVRTEIEKIEGRIRYLQNQSEMSTIKVLIQTPRSIAAQSIGFFGRLADSAQRGAEGAVNFTLGFVTFLIGAFPFALFIGLPVFLIGRSVWSRKINTMSITEIAKEEIKNE